MELELKRPIKKNLIIYLSTVLIGIVFALVGCNFADEFYYFGIGIAILCGVFAINEFIKAKGKKLFFDENGFTVSKKKIQLQGY